MLTTDILTQLFYHTLAFIWIAYVLTRGIKGGIEKMNLVLMPTLKGPNGSSSTRGTNANRSVTAAATIQN